VEVSEDVPEDPEASFQGLVVFFLLDTGPEADVKVGTGMAGYGWYKGVA